MSSSLCHEGPCRSLGLEFATMTYVTKESYVTNHYAMKANVGHCTRRKRPFSNQPIFNDMLGTTCLQLHNYIYFNNSMWPTSHLNLVDFLTKSVSVRH